MDSNPITLAEPLRSPVVDALESAREKVDSYLRAWQVPDDWRNQIVQEVMLATKTSMAIGQQHEATAFAIGEAERLLGERLNELVNNGGEATDLDIELCLALICGELPEKWSAENSAELNASYERGRKRLELMQQNLRRLETQVDTMETSLTRLPSFRMVAGWILLILLILIAFKLTH